MRIHRRRTLVLVLALTAVAIRCLGQAADVAIVVRKDVPVDNLSLADVRKLFMGERQFWNSSLRVTLLVRAPTSRERDVVLKKIYQMSEAQFRQYWISRVFRAETATGPKIVYSSEMTMELVNGIPGAVAFLDASRVPAGLKVVKVNNRAPGEKDYPLR
jgi:ABC-type phosphate transport system substrate-binding protein